MLLLYGILYLSLHKGNINQQKTRNYAELGYKHFNYQRK
jgi:hypothetical protein